MLTERTRTEWRQERWMSKVRDHTVSVGYGTKGSSAAETLLENGLAPESIVVVDTDPARIAEANRRGLVGVVGDGSRGELLERPADVPDVDKEPGAVKEPVLAVIRGSRTLRYDDASIGTIQITDRLVVVRSVPENRSGGRTSPPYRPGPYRAPGPERP